MLWNLFEISINAYEAFLMIYFLKSRLHFKKNSPIADCLCLISCTLFYSAYIYFDIFLQHLALLSTPGLYRAIYVVASNLILSIVIFSASKIRKDIFGLSWSVMFVFLFMSLSILVSEECLYQLQIRTHFNSYIFSIGYLGLLICSILSILLFHFNPFHLSSVLLSLLSSTFRFTPPHAHSPPIQSKPISG